MEDTVRSSLFDPAAARGLVLAHRPPAGSAAADVVSDRGWAAVVRLLRWAAAGTRGAGTRQAGALETGTWWRLAAGCADLLRTLPGLAAELGEPWSVEPPYRPDLPGAERVAVAADRLATLLAAVPRVPLRVLAAEVDALGEAAVTALAGRCPWQVPSDPGSGT
jgi:hypothetical protein